MSGRTLEDVVSQAIADHGTGQDWHCACGVDFFGGTAAYSWGEWMAHRNAHVAAEVRAWLAEELAGEGLREAVERQISADRLTWRGGPDETYDELLATAALTAVRERLTTPGAEL